MLRRTPRPPHRISVSLLQPLICLVTVIVITLAINGTTSLHLGNTLGETGLRDLLDPKTRLQGDVRLKLQKRFSPTWTQVRLVRHVIDKNHEALQADIETNPLALVTPVNPMIHKKVTEPQKL